MASWRSDLVLIDHCVSRFYCIWQFLSAFSNCVCPSINWAWPKDIFFRFLRLEHWLSRRLAQIAQYETVCVNAPLPRNILCRVLTFLVLVDLRALQWHTGLGWNIPYDRNPWIEENDLNLKRAGPWVKEACLKGKAEYSWPCIYYFFDCNRWWFK